VGDEDKAGACFPRNKTRYSPTTLELSSARGALSLMPGPAPICFPLVRSTVMQWLFLLFWAMLQWEKHLCCGLILICARQQESYTHYVTLPRRPRKLGSRAVCNSRPLWQGGGVGTRCVGRFLPVRLRRRAIHPPGDDNNGCVGDGGAVAAAWVVEGMLSKERRWSELVGVAWTEMMGTVGGGGCEGASRKSGEEREGDWSRVDYWRR